MLSFVERHVVASILGAVVLAFLVYETSVRFFAYSGDAYVATDVIFIAPEVSGPLAKVVVGDDAPVAAGAVLAEIERQPFALAVAAAEAQVTLAAERIRLAEAAIDESTAMVSAARASLDNARRQQTRSESLSQTGDISAEALDTVRRDAAVAAADLQKAESLAAVAQTLVTVRRAEQATAAQALAKASYELSRTRIVSPVKGRVAPLTVRTGDYATAGKPLAAVVSDLDWHIVAAVDERHLARLKPGQSVLFTIGSDPWRPHWGTVRSISPGIARSAGEDGALPYVPLSTDWIRLPRRFPVLIDMGDLPARERLYRGADARVLIWF
ncbi:HlyD family secretion protein [Xanthobacter flavus]|uniref:HlyD family secretion protein n=1 Tax=Xanthobacter flavus TaxID=281 RepID=UPI003729B2F9